MQVDFLKSASITAARAGAKHVVACEVFKPLAALAQSITQLNVPDLVDVIPKMSTHLTVGDDADDRGKIGQAGGDELETEAYDMPRKADVLVWKII